MVTLTRSNAFTLRFLAAFLLAAATPAGAVKIQRVNVNPATQAQADGLSSSPALSADGNIIAFVSQSTTLVAGYGLTAASPAQIYVYDRTANTIEIVSVSNSNAVADGNCRVPQVSADGRYVAFVSGASNLPVASSGALGGVGTIYIRDRQNLTTVMPMQSWPKTLPSITGVADTAYSQHYLSANAARLAFDFGGSPRYSVYTLAESVAASTLTDVCPAAATDCIGAAISGDGGSIAFWTSHGILAGDTNGFADIYVYDVAGQSYALASINADGVTQGNGDVTVGNVALSNDGTIVAFSSLFATNFANSNTQNVLAVKNLTTGALALASVNDDGTPESVGSPQPTLSSDGTRIAFTSNSFALAPHPSKASQDALVRDMTAGRLRSICQAANGAYGDSGCIDATLSADGHWAAFTSASTKLVANDTNGQQDIFLVALDAALDTIFLSGFEQ